jgi:hypothetical protein
MNEVNVLVIAAQRWDFDDSEGQNHRGTTVYVAHVNEPQSDYYAGHKPVKYTMSHEQYDSFKAEKLPAMAKMTVEYDFDRQKMVPKLFSDFEPLDL